MAWRFRKSKSLGAGARLNVGKKSASVSFGVPGLRMSVGTKGVTRTVGIPGTGLSNTKRLGSGKGSNDADETTDVREPARELDLLGTFAIIVGFFGVGLSLVPMSIGSIAFGVLGLAAGIAVFAWGVRRVLRCAANCSSVESDDESVSYGETAPEA